MAATIVARSGELGAIHRFLDGIAAGPIGLVIDGPAGIGKSTLWQESVRLAEARDIRVLRARPTEAEATFSYLAVADLVGPAFDETAAGLAEPQRRALSAALLRSDPDGATDGRVVATATVALVAALTERSPVVLALDDTQWLDPASRAVLEFAMRRLSGPIGVVVAQRASAVTEAPLGLDRALPESRLEHVLPGPLSLAAIHRLLTNRLERPIPRPVLSWIVAESEGNPFFALELARAWARTDRGPGTPWAGWASDRDTPGDGGTKAVPGSLRALLDGRLRALSTSTRRALQVAAAMPRPHRAGIEAVVGDIVSRQAISEAVAAGVLVEDRDRLRFEHPLVASAVLDAMSDEERQAIHDRLASLTDDPEERAHHLASGRPGSDEAVAAHVETGARAAGRRGAILAALGLWEAACRLTPATEIDALNRRRVGLAAMRLRSGDPEGARAGAEIALAATTDAYAGVDALLVLADVAWSQGTLQDANARLTAAAAASRGEPQVQGRIFSRLAGFNLALDGEHAAHCASDAVALLDPVSEPAWRSYALMSGFFAEVSLGRSPRLELLEDGLRLETAAGPDATLSSVPLIWYNGTDDADRARSRHSVEATWYADRGNDGWLAERQSHLALVELRAGNWDLADRLTEASCAVLATYDGEGAWQLAFAWRALVDAHRGRPDRARSTLAPMIAATRQQGNRQWSGLMLSVLGFTEFAAGDAAGSDRAFVEMRAAFDAIGFAEAIGDRSEPCHVEALLALGDLERARAVLHRLEERWRALPRPWIAVALPRARALILAADGDVPGALNAIAEADPDGAARLPFEAAWTRLVEGQLLRRAGRRREAAGALTEALAVFDRLGAPAWSERADRELRRVGLRHVGPDELTTTERRIAELAAAGLTNREVAVQAFVSPKTVEANLARVYRKLGIRSRAELGRRIGGAEAESET